MGRYHDVTQKYTSNRSRISDGKPTKFKKVKPKFYYYFHNNKAIKKPT